MIDEIRLRFGSGPQSPKLSFQAAPITVFVGPNNSGKSRVLLEIQQFCTAGTTYSSTSILDAIEFRKLADEVVEKEIARHTIRPRPDELLPEGDILFGDPVRSRTRMGPNVPRVFLKDPNVHKADFTRHYLAFRTLKLDGENRITLVNDQALGDLQQPPQNPLATLFHDDDKRLEVRRIIEDAFKFFFVLDPTQPGVVRVGFSKVKPSSHQLEKGLHKEAIDFHRDVLRINQVSDGVKAFTGIITSLIAGSPLVTIIDEPEAFLHPSLSFKLGKEIASAMNGGVNRLFVSTHNENFLMGCIQSGSPVNIVRLTYSDNIGTARMLNNDRIKELMRSPMLRSTGVLKALFYEHVVVTEGDSDRAFYNEINERLVEFENSKSISNCLFINAQGKDTIWKIVKPLREMGIPTVAIYDIDILKNERSNWTNALKASFIPEPLHQPLGQLRSNIVQKFKESGKEMGDGGLDILAGSDKEAADELLNQLETYGIFVVRKGAVESWLSYLGIQSHKSEWLSKIFERMGEDPKHADYVKPQKGDAWDFIAKMKLWMADKNRKGIPA